MPKNDTDITDDERMPDKNQKMGKWNSYNTSEEFLAAPNFRKYVEEYHAYKIYRSLVHLQDKYECMIDL